MTPGDERDLVRRGYDALSYHYRSDDAGEGTYASWLEDAGLEVTEQGFIPEGSSGHALFWARRQP